MREAIRRNTDTQANHHQQPPNSTRNPILAQPKLIFLITKLSIRLLFLMSPNFIQHIQVLFWFYFFFYLFLIFYHISFREGFKAYWFIFILVIASFSSSCSQIDFHLYTMLYMISPCFIKSIFLYLSNVVHNFVCRCHVFNIWYFYGAFFELQFFIR